MTEDQFRRVLEREIKEAGSLRALAKRLGVSAAYLCDVRFGRRAAGPKVLGPMGFKRIVQVRRLVQIRRAAS